MKRTTLTLGSVGIAGLVTTGLLALPVTSAVADDTALKRDEDTPDVVLVADEDDDDTADRDGDDPVAQHQRRRQQRRHQQPRDRGQPRPRPQPRRQDPRLHP